MAAATEYCTHLALKLVCLPHRRLDLGILFLGGFSQLPRLRLRAFQLCLTVGAHKIYTGDKQEEKTHRGGGTGELWNRSVIQLGGKEEETKSVCAARNKLGNLDLVPGNEDRMPSMAVSLPLSLLLNASLHWRARHQNVDTYLCSQFHPPVLTHLNTSRDYLACLGSSQGSS